MILFDNKLRLGTCVIKTMNRADWDHVGVVVRKPDGFTTKLTDIYLLEALHPKVVLKKWDRVKCRWFCRWIQQPSLPSLIMMCETACITRLDSCMKTALGRSSTGV